MPRQEQQPLIGREIHAKEEIIIPMSARQSVCSKFRQRVYKWALCRRLHTCSFLTSHGICLRMCGTRHLSGLFMNRMATCLWRQQLSMYVSIQEALWTANNINN